MPNIEEIDPSPPNFAFGAGIAETIGTAANIYLADVDIPTYFVFFDKNPLPDKMSNLAGFSRKALISEVGNTALAAQLQVASIEEYVSGDVSGGNTVRDPVRKVSRSVWAPNDDFSGVVFADDRLQTYDNELDFTDNLSTIDFNEEGFGGLKVVYATEDDGQDQLYVSYSTGLPVSDSTGLPIRRNKFILSFDEFVLNTDAQSLSDRRAQNIAYANALFESMFYPNNQVKEDNQLGYFADTSFGDLPPGAITPPDKLFVPFNKKVGLFNVEDPIGAWTFGMPVGQVPQLSTYQFTDHTIEIDLPFPIKDFDMTNFSVNALLGDYDILYNPGYTNQNIVGSYETLASAIPETHGMCAYTLVSQELNEIKDIKNGTYNQILSLAGSIGTDVMNADLTKMSGVKTYLNTYTAAYSAYAFGLGLDDMLRKNRNIIIRDQEILKQTNKIKNIVPYGINIRFKNTQTPDYAKLLKNFGLDLALMCNVAESYTPPEPDTTAPPHEVLPTSVEFAAMIQDTVLTESFSDVSDETGEEVGSDVTSAGPVPVNFFDASAQSYLTWDLIEILDSIKDSNNGSLAGFLNNAQISNNTLVQNEEEHFSPSNNFFLKNLAVDVCKTELVQRASAKTRSVFDIYSGAKAEYEILFFRIEKSRIDQDPAAENGILQNFFIYNDGQSMNEYLDTQVKYGQSYRYRVFAYALVYGTQYQPFIDDPDYNRQDTVFISPVTDITSDGDTDNNVKSFSYSFVGEVPLPLSFLYKPSLKLVEVPYHTYEELFVLDKPPLAPEVQFFPYKYIDNKLFISLVNSNGLLKEAPVVLNEAEADLVAKHEIAQKLGSSFINEDFLIFSSDDEPSRYEIFRTRQRPSGYGDFSRIEELVVGEEGKFFIDSVAPNTDYWYFFRAIDIHGNFSNPSFVYKVRLISDNVSYLSIQQYSFNGDDEPEGPVTFSKFLNVNIDEDAPPMNRTIKMRIKSIQTGKKVDLNVDFSQTQVAVSEPETN